MNIRQLESELQEAYNVQDEMLSRIEELQDELKLAAAAVARLYENDFKQRETIALMKNARIILNKKSTMKGIMSVN